MPHGVFGLGWGEVVSFITLGTVVATYFKTSISKTAHESSRKDLEDLSSKLTDFKINVNELSSLLRQFNQDLSRLTKRVEKTESQVEELKLEMVQVKEHLKGNDPDEQGSTCQNYSIKRAVELH